MSLFIIQQRLSKKQTLELLETLDPNCALIFIEDGVYNVPTMFRLSQQQNLQMKNLYILKAHAVERGVLDIAPEFKQVNTQQWVELCIQYKKTSHYSIFACVN